MSKISLSIKNLHVSYGKIQALKGIDISVETGKIVALLGSNGAGKTTTLKTISGLTSDVKGFISFEDRNILGCTPVEVTKLGVIHAPEGRQIFPELTVQENLRIGAFTIADKQQIKRNFQKVFEYFPILEERKTQIAGTLSGGEQQMLAIARALMASPKLLLLDEPSLGLAPLIVRDLFNIVKEINTSGTTVLIVEQNALQTLKIADYAYVLEVGEVNMHGKADDLIKDNKLIEAYLGSH